MKPLSMHIDGIPVEATQPLTILEAARRADIDIPHLCHCDRQGYQPLASCRACLVEIDEEAALAPACRRWIAPGMVVTTSNERIDNVRRLVVELTASEMSNEAFAKQGAKSFGALAQSIGVDTTRFGFKQDTGRSDTRHAAITVDADACIRCGLCRMACQDVQMNGVIAMASRNTEMRVAFDLGKPLVESGCVSCGECVQVCPTGALSPVTNRADARDKPIDRSAETICPFCSIGCRVDLKITENRIVYAEGADGPANHGRLCVKGRFGFDYVSHPDRLTVPLIRRADAPKDPTAHLAAKDVLALFREASWEEALDRAAAGFLDVKHKHGLDALAVLGSAKATNEDAYILQKLARTGFQTNHVDHCTRLCASVPPLAEAIGYSAVTAPIAHVFDADVALIVGSNPEVNHPVAASFIKNAIRRGTKLILVDPYRQPLARHATHHLQLRPGTDVVLLSAMTHVVISEGLYDRSFVSERLEGFDEIAKCVANYPPETAARICGIPAHTIVEAAHLFAKAPAAMCFWGMGASQHVHGADNIRALIALALISGQVGRPGAGLHPLRGQNNVQGSCDAGLTPATLPGYRKFDDLESRHLIDALWKSSPPTSPGLTVVEILDAALAGRIKGLYVVGGNPAMANPDLAATRRALAALDHLVVQDIFPTETAAFADVILPAAALAERSGSVTNTDRYVQLLEPALAPPGLARPDWEIIHEIAHRMGVVWGFNGVGEIFDEMTQAVPLLTGFTWDSLTREKSQQYPLSLSRAEASLFKTVFPRSGGRARLVPVSGRAPGELPNPSFPLVLITGRVREHWHTGSMTRRSRVLDALSPEPFVHVSSADFDWLDLAENNPTKKNWVDVETERGSVRLQAVRDDRIQDGVIWMAMSFFEAAANELTPRHLDPTTRVPEYKFCAARLLPVKSNN